MEGKTERSKKAKHNKNRLKTKSSESKWKAHTTSVNKRRRSEWSSCDYCSVFFIFFSRYFFLYHFQQEKRKKKRKKLKIKFLLNVRTNTLRIRFSSLFVIISVVFISVFVLSVRPKRKRYSRVSTTLLQKDQNERKGESVNEMTNEWIAFYFCEFLIVFYAHFYIIHIIITSRNFKSWKSDK